MELNSNLFAAITSEQLKTVFQNMLNVLADAVLGAKEFAELASIVDTEGDELKRKMLETMLYLRDQNYALERQNKKDFVISHSKSKKTITTVFGAVTLHRNRYFNKNTKKGYYFIDEVYELDSHQRVDKGLQTRLIEEVTNSSYRKTSSIYNDLVSH